jgi:hypothetical protein
VHLEEPPVAESRTTAYQMIRSPGPVARDAHGAYMITDASPDAIDFSRKQRHFTFGGGPHVCLGKHLARLKMRVVLAEWHRRIPDYQPANGASDRVAWPAGLVGMPSLPLTFQAGGGTSAGRALPGSSARASVVANDATAKGELCLPSCAGSASGRSGSCSR